MTLVELIITITISSIIFVIVLTFITNSIEDLLKNNIEVESIDKGFTFKDDINRLIKGGYNSPEIFSGSTTINDVLYLKDYYNGLGVLIGVVNLETKKIQQDYVYGDNYIGYRKLSNVEILEIDSDNSKIYDKIFQDDKIYRGLRVKDFNVDLYNGETIIDIYLSVINSNYVYNFGESFDNIFIEKDSIMEFNLVY